jgi:nucleotide-binding universal stress UspA family protein
MAKRILVPLDRSSASEAVLPVIGDAARGAGATVRLLHIAPVPDAVEREYGRVAADSDRVMERATAEGESYLEGASASLQGIPVERVVRFGDPAREILVEAEAWGADLIAVTATPASPFRRLVRRGGVADRVTRGAAAPVLLYRPRRDRRRAGLS